MKNDKSAVVFAKNVSGLDVAYYLSFLLCASWALFMLLLLLLLLFPPVFL